MIVDYLALGFYVRCSLSLQAHIENKLYWISFSFSPWQKWQWSFLVQALFWLTACFQKIDYQKSWFFSSTVEEALFVSSENCCHQTVRDNHQSIEVSELFKINQSGCEQLHSEKNTNTKPHKHKTYFLYCLNKLQIKLTVTLPLNSDNDLWKARNWVFCIKQISQVHS